MSKHRIVVGLSGGVDSAVTAHLLKQQGHEVVGIFMKNWDDDDDSEYCASNQDFIDAAAVADVIGIEIEHVNFAADYKDRVFAEFLREYSAGRTPNPDVLCNAEIKFKAFLDHAMRLGAEKIATGHYARVRRCPANTGEPGGPQQTSHPTAREGARVRDHYQLLKGLDPAKDQSYFLHRLTQAQLAKTLFPIGELHKTEVRRIAAEIGLPNAKKKDSTGICFIGERPFREFLNRYLQTKPGPIKDERGRKIGEHVGLSFYTLGQRQGLGIGGVKEKGAQRGGGDHAPWFVARKDMATNTLYAVQGHDHPWLLSHALVFDDAAWTASEPPRDGAFAAKTRYRQQDAACALSSGDAPGSFRLRFAEPQWAVTPGQSAVLYDGDVCLGGGVIASAETLEIKPNPPLVHVKQALSAINN
ncbi:tRNA 2-thiouridine(34) synthase MnmA [Ottowia testudinis]|uniref:tRNA-specific 2-thiouridylase MnmA n=1 Tax=Ottowia testudinis TaxID=2816950 RepID=A0A975H3Y9_9BURK|nr:tRNA 2-thiouridine(34) synthase MnmA [Ottowia testudinis]QTD45795.1 tRNA 2-thiouridine(34) synthase MnmA [Ottowia testudinis]